MMNRNFAYAFLAVLAMASTFNQARAEKDDASYIQIQIVGKSEPMKLTLDKVSKEKLKPGVFKANGNETQDIHACFSGSPTEALKILEAMAGNSHKWAVKKNAEEAKAKRVSITYVNTNSKQSRTVSAMLLPECRVDQPLVDTYDSEDE